MYEKCDLCDLGVLGVIEDECSQSGGEGISSYENLSRDGPEQSKSTSTRHYSNE